MTMPNKRSLSDVRVVIVTKNYLFLVDVSSNSIIDAITIGISTAFLLTS
jgi:hypothetical protein